MAFMYRNFLVAHLMILVSFISYSEGLLTGSHWPFPSVYTDTVFILQMEKLCCSNVVT